MIRTQISLTEEQMAAARREAARRGVSVAALLRDALDRLLHESSDHRLREQARRAVGGFRSGAPKTSEEHDQALAETARW